MTIYDVARGGAIWAAGMTETWDQGNASAGGMVHALPECVTGSLDADTTWEMRALEIAGRDTTDQAWTATATNVLDDMLADYGAQCAEASAGRAVPPASPAWCPICWMNHALSAVYANASNRILQVTDDE